MGDIDALISRINKKQGSAVLVRGSELRHLSFERCTTGSFAFDVMLGGGWPLNSWNEIVGQESHGKSVMALKTIAANQARNPHHETLWVASEEFNREWAEQLGVNLAQITFAMTNVMEVAYQTVIEMLDERAVDAVVIDSYPALTPHSEWDAAMEDWSVGLGARLTNKFMRKSGTAQRRSLIEDDRPCLGLIINQWRDKIGVFMGDPRTTPGGRGKNFHYFTRVEVVRDEWITRGDTKIGQTIKAKTIKNKTAPPQRVAQVDFYFEEHKPFAKGDYDTAKELASISLAYDIIEQHGSWYHYGGERWQGKAAVTEHVREDFPLQDKLREEINRVVYHILPTTVTETRKIRRKK